MQWTSPCCQWNTLFCFKVNSFGLDAGRLFIYFDAWSIQGIVSTAVGRCLCCRKLWCLGNSVPPCSPHIAQGWGVWSPSCCASGWPAQLWRWSVSFAGFLVNACWSLSITHPVWDQRSLPHLSWGARPSVLDAFPCKGSSNRSKGLGNISPIPSDSCLLGFRARLVVMQVRAAPGPLVMKEELPEVLWGDCHQACKCCFHSS